MAGVVLHIPHASRVIPDDIRPSLLLSNDDIEAELLRMTDAYTDDLFGSALPHAPVIVFGVSRLVVDPERFEDDGDEPMAAMGMGAVYERTSDGRPLRRPPSPGERSALLERFYRPHHARLTAAVDDALGRSDRCVVIDGHSFPSVPLPYELDQSPDRPDICIGTDDFHTPPALGAAAVAAVRAAGWSVAVDRPFSGALVPRAHYRNDSRVTAVMVEVNRRLYMDEATGHHLPQFTAVANRLRSVLTTLTQTAAK